MSEPDGAKPSWGAPGSAQQQGDRSYGPPPVEAPLVSAAKVTHRQQEGPELEKKDLIHPQSHHHPAQSRADLQHSPPWNPQLVGSSASISRYLVSGLGSTEKNKLTRAYTQGFKFCPTLLGLSPEEGAAPYTTVGAAPNQVSR